VKYLFEICHLTDWTRPFNAVIPPSARKPYVDILRRLVVQLVSNGQITVPNHRIKLKYWELGHSIIDRYFKVMYLLIFRERRNKMHTPKDPLDQPPFYAFQIAVGLLYCFLKLTILIIS